MRKQFLVDADDAPPLTGEELRRPEGKWRIGGKVVSAKEGKEAFRKAWKRKIRTNIHLDSDVIAHYKAQAGDRGYQTLINAALRRDMEGSSLKNDLLQAMKDELSNAIKAELIVAMENRVTPTVTTPIKTLAISAVMNMPMLHTIAAGSTVITSAGTVICVERIDAQGQAGTRTNSDARFFDLHAPMGHA